MLVIPDSLGRHPLLIEGSSPMPALLLHEVASTELSFVQLFIGLMCGLL